LEIDSMLSQIEVTFDFIILKCRHEYYLYFFYSLTSDSSLLYRLISPVATGFFNDAQ